jgi:hypothetical protein
MPGKSSGSPHLESVSCQRWRTKGHTHARARSGASMVLKRMMTTGKPNWRW